MKNVVLIAGLLAAVLSACTPATHPSTTLLPFKEGEIWELAYVTVQGQMTYTFTLSQPKQVIPAQELWHWPAAGPVEAGFNYAGRPASGLPFVSFVWYPGGSLIAQVCSQVRPVMSGSVHTVLGHWTADMTQLGRYQATGIPGGLPPCTLTRIKSAP